MEARPRRMLLLGIAALVAAIFIIGYGSTLQAAEGTAAAPGPLRLVENGKSDFSICVSRAASPSERRGAEELQSFLEQMSGARLPIISDDAAGREHLVLVGDSPALRKLGAAIPFEQLGPEGFALKIVGLNLVVAGGKERGTMYGVYTFLEKLGCRWFTADVSRIPRMPTIVVEPLDEVHKPAFEYREPYWSEAFEKDWAARNKVNGGNSKLDLSTGGKIEYYPFVHSFYSLIPPEKYFKDHPEYFSLIDGQRRAGRGQLCLSNEHVARLTAQTVLQWIEQHPEATIFSVSQNDWDGWCECDGCRRIEREEGGTSGLLLRFVNSVAAEVETRYPGKLVDTLAYQSTESPPLKARPRSNVRIRLCPIGACEAHPYQTCDRNGYFMRNLLGWSKITSKIYVWHYTTNFSHYLLPFPDFDELASDIPMYRRHGVVGLFMQGAVTAGGGGENAELRSYVLARLLWDTNSDVEKAIDEFHDAYYGRAAKPMRAYFDLIHRLVRFPPHGEGQHIWIRRAPSFSDETLRQAKELFGQAEAAAEDEAIRGRVRKASLAVAYAEMLRSKTFTVRDGRYEPADVDAARARFQNVMQEARNFGVTTLGEGTELEEAEREFAARVRSYRAASIENAALRVEMAPELSGRIIRLIDKKTGKDVLSQPHPGDPDYPDRGGLGLFVYADFHAREPFEVKWELAGGSNDRELILSGAASNGLRLRRRIQLEKNERVLRTKTVVENIGPAAVPVAVQSVLEPDPGAADMLDLDVTFRRRDGSRQQTTVFSPGQLYKGAATYQGKDLPNGEWRIVNRGLGVAVVNRFSKDQAARATISWRARGENRFVFGLWSAQHVLEPGKTLKLETEYAVEQISAAPAR